MQILLLCLEGQYFIMMFRLQNWDIHLIFSLIKIVLHYIVENLVPKTLVQYNIALYGKQVIKK